MFVRMFACACVIAISSTAASAQMKDCDYKTRFYGTNATLQVRDGKPVAYSTSNYVASSVSMQGDTILIDKASLSNVVAGKTNQGRWIVRGDWKLGSSRKNNVTFVCE